MTLVKCPTCGLEFAEINLEYVSEETIEALLKAHWHYDCESPPKPSKKR